MAQTVPAVPGLRSRGRTRLDSARIIREDERPQAMPVRIFDDEAIGERIREAIGHTSARSLASPCRTRPTEAAGEPVSYLLVSAGLPYRYADRVSSLMGGCLLNCLEQSSRRLQREQAANSCMSGMEMHALAIVSSLQALP